MKTTPKLHPEVNSLTRRSFLAAAGLIAGKSAASAAGPSTRERKNIHISDLLVAKPVDALYRSSYQRFQRLVVSAGETLEVPVVPEGAVVLMRSELLAFAAYTDEFARSELRDLDRGVWAGILGASFASPDLPDRLFAIKVTKTGPVVGESFPLIVQILENGVEIQQLTVTASLPPPPIIRRPPFLNLTLGEPDSGACLEHCSGWPCPCYLRMCISYPNGTVCWFVNVGGP